MYALLGLNELTEKHKSSNYNVTGGNRTMVAAATIVRLPPVNVTDLKWVNPRGLLPYAFRCIPGRDIDSNLT